MPQYASYSWLPAAVREFETKFPSVEIEIVSEAAVRPRHALSRDEVDIALLSSPTQNIQLDRSRYQSRLLIRDEFVALLPADHRKASRPFLVADDFIDETYITNSAVPERNREYELFFQPNSVYPERVVQVGFTGPILKLVAAGIGTTIITRWILESVDRLSGVVSRPLTKSGLFVNWFAVFPRKLEAKAQALALCDIIASSGARDLNEKNR
jgi:LysR family transcriptional regulator for metE and metH